MLTSAAAVTALSNSYQQREMLTSAAAVTTLSNSYQQREMRAQQQQ